MSDEGGGRTQHNVYIGPEFFAKEKRAYNNWQQACVRELLQNCMDAPGSQNIELGVSMTAEGDVQLTAKNDGAPMTRDELINKFFALGGSTKDSTGTVGGMGVAKVIIAFIHKCYRIHTGNMLVCGSGASYTIEECIPYHGTETVVTFLEKDAFLATRLHSAIKFLVSRSSIKQQVRLDSEIVTERIAEGTYRRNLEFGTVKTNTITTNELVVRAGGLPMFTRYVDYKGQIVVDLTKPSTEVLTANRDSLRSYEFREELDKFVSDLAGNKARALQPKLATQRIKVPGYKITGVIKRASGKVLPKNTPVNVSHVRAALAGTDLGTADSWDVTDLVNAGLVSGTRNPPTPHCPEFFIKNESGYKVPDDYMPERFSGYSKRVIFRWTALLTELAAIYKSTKPFSIGFIFTDDGTEAEYEEYNGDKVMYVKPADLVRVDGKKPTFKTKWPMGGDRVWDFIATAAHEFVHYNWDLTSHNEDYARQLTDVMATCLRERVRLLKVFKTPVVW